MDIIKVVEDTISAIQETQDIIGADMEQIPDSWVDEKGIRHCVIWDQSYPDYCRVIKVNDKWELIENAPF